MNYLPRKMTQASRSYLIYFIRNEIGSLLFTLIQYKYPKYTRFTDYAFCEIFMQTQSNAPYIIRDDHVEFL